MNIYWFFTKYTPKHNPKGLKREVYSAEYTFKGRNQNGKGKETILQKMVHDCPVRLYWYNDIW